jgi:hypothetical protein
MEGALPIIFLAVILKIPVFFGIWLVWWASRSYDEFAEAEGEGGSRDHGFRRWRREPRGPRRGPHGGAPAYAAPDCPPGGRTRVLRRPAEALAPSGRRADKG